MKKIRNNDIGALCEYLGLKKLASGYEQEIAEAHKKNPGYYQFLESILQNEAAHRNEQRIAYRLKESRLPKPHKLIADFDFDFQPGLNKHLIMDLARLEFITRKESILFMGDCGTGKSHLAQSIALKACEKGYRALYTTCSQLISDLNTGVYDKTLAKRIKRYVVPDLLLIDEMGHDRLELEVTKEAHLLFKVIDERYKLSLPLIFTTNVVQEDWADYLGDPISTRAILDRIFHRSIKIEIKGPSYRKHEGEILQKKYKETNVNQRPDKSTA